MPPDRSAVLKDKRQMKYYIIAGEASGDLHGSNLIKGLLKADPGAQFRFWGGDFMADAAGSSGELVRHYKEASIMGFWEVVKKLRRVLGQMKFCRKDIAAWEPDVLVLIDYPGFNFRMARFAKQSGIPSYYYIAPKVWAWKEGRVKKIRKYVDRLFVIFPFEIEYFRRHGIEAYYAGNPIMDSIAQRQAATAKTFEEFSRENGLDGKPVVALVAGSRTHEIDYNLPVMVEVSRRFPDYQFVVTGVSWLDKALYDKYLDGSGVAYVCDKTYETLSFSTAAMVTSGTATLEAALLKIPEVVCFRGPKLTIWIAYRLVKVRFISLVNLIMDREVVKELIQYDFTIDSAAEELQAILAGGSKYETLKEDYRQLAGIVGPPGASERVAAEMAEFLKKDKAR